MTRVGRKGIQRSDKVARRTDRKQRRTGRAVAGAAALATVAAIGAGQAVEPATADAASTSSILEDLRDWSAGYDSKNPLGSLVSEIGNGELTTAIAEQWRIQSCVSTGTRGGSDCTQSSTELGGLGIALVLPDRIEVVPVAVYDPVKGVFDTLSGSALGDIVRWLGIKLPEKMTDPPATSGSSTVAGTGYQLAVAFRGGDASAVSYLPLSIATAGASDGKTATSFALIGMAHAWNTGPLDVTALGVPVPGAQIPGVTGVGCYGGLTSAYAEGVGACANVLGTFDFRFRQPNGEVQFALTDPTALISDPGGVLGGVGSEVLQGLLAGILSGSGVDFDGDWMSLSKDFARLSIGGDHDLFSGNFLRLTSDYGFTGPITVDWLGSTVTFRPLVEVNGELRPNRLGRPVIELGQLDTGELIPVLRIPSYELPFGLPATRPIDTGARNQLSDRAGAPGEQLSAIDAFVATEDVGGDSAESYVGKHRAAEDSYVGKHRLPAETPDSDDATGGVVDSGGGADTDDSADGDGSADTDDSADTGSTDSDAGTDDVSTADADSPADSDGSDTDSAGADSSDSPAAAA
ncbi:MSCRAMM family adhesin SdrC [Gordonia sp. 'Campus']|uniref:MSCRAMM family adhesin SdrC n=1 Tax=Gordonia sp. 'Campus' TaxID=2915824 RepID=UPI001FD8B172|nr:MSCRAMM family adhesin SdrC [Gordonia sp. 'Campus']